MKTNFLPAQLPFLPGNTYADPTITSYHKTQLLGVKDGVNTGTSIFKKYNLHSLEKTQNLQTNVDASLVKSMREGVSAEPSQVVKRVDEVQDAIPKIAPRWLKYDKQVSIP